MSFADRHVKLLEKCPQAQLVVVGSGEPDDWKAAKARVGGRITGLSEVPDPKRYFEAADIYVDFVSVRFVHLDDGSCGIWLAGRHHLYLAGRGQDFRHQPRRSRRDEPGRQDGRRVRHDA